jgi:polyhydroxybutyrate depolymerase
MKLVCAAVPLVSLSFAMLSCGTGNRNSVATPTVSSRACSPQQDANCHSLTVNRVTRTYLLHVPASFQPNSSALVIAMGGGGNNGKDMETFTELDTKSDQAGFAVAYPDELINPSEGSTNWSFHFSNFTDDIGFLRQLITTLQATVHPDPKKIYVTGGSSGAAMSHRVGVELSDLVAAIGVVEGSLDAVSPGDTQAHAVPPAVAPVSVLIFHGDQDAQVPYCGGVQPGGAEVASQDQSFGYWTGASANNCSTVDATALLCDGSGNITLVVEKDATGCKGNVEVKFYRLIGGMHQWYLTPMNVSGQVPYNPNFDAMTGTTTNNILWNFFAAHPKP